MMHGVHPSTIAFLRGLATLVAVVAVSAAAGAGAGYGLSRAFGDEAGATDELDLASARPSSVTQPEPRLTVRSATLQLATSSTGAARERARVTVRLRARNPGRRSLKLGSVRIEARGDVAKADPNADDEAGDLLEPIAGGSSATGTLRFETAGALTDTLKTTRSARLRIGGKTVPLELKRVSG